MQNCFCYRLSERQNKNVLNANESFKNSVFFLRSSQLLGAVVFVKNNQI